jgi:ketosteroid isomerase-like protein
LFDLRATGKGSGAEVQRGDAMVCTVRDEKIAKVVYYNDQARARAEAGLA